MTQCQVLQENFPKISGAKKSMQRIIVINNKSRKGRVLLPWDFHNFFHLSDKVLNVVSVKSTHLIVNFNDFGYMSATWFFSYKEMCIHLCHSYGNMFVRWFYLFYSLIALSIYIMILIIMSPIGTRQWHLRVKAYLWLESWVPCCREIWYRLNFYYFTSKTKLLASLQGRCIIYINTTL